MFKSNNNEPFIVKLIEWIFEVDNVQSGWNCKQQSAWTSCWHLKK